MQLIIALQPTPEADECKKIFSMISDHQLIVPRFATRLTKHAEFITARNQLMTQLYLDNSQERDLEFWTQQTRTFLGFGGKEVKINDTSYRVPTRIHHMMTVLKTDFPDKESFMAAFNKARSAKPSCFSNPFSFLTRKKNTSTVYNTGNITNLQITEDPNEGWKLITRSVR